jgi:MoxR-like ATPase
VRLVVVCGLPGVGKLTLARELAAVARYKLFRNHVVVGMLLPVLAFGSAGFVEMREAVWASVLERAAREGVDGPVFTSAPERTVREGFVDFVAWTILFGSNGLCCSRGRSFP